MNQDQPVPSVAKKQQEVATETSAGQASSGSSVARSAEQIKSGESMILKIKNGEYPGDEVVVELEFMEEAPAKSIQPPGYPFVALIRYPGIDTGYVQYLVANHDGHVLDVKAWDEEDGPHGEVMDSWYYPKAFDEPMFKSFAIDYAANQDQADLAKSL